MIDPVEHEALRINALTWELRAITSELNLLVAEYEKSASFRNFDKAMFDRVKEVWVLLMCLSPLLGFFDFSFSNYNSYISLAAILTFGFFVLIILRAQKKQWDENTKNLKLLHENLTELAKSHEERKEAIVAEYEQGLFDNAQ